MSRFFMVQCVHRHFYCSCRLDLDSDPITLIYQPDLDIAKMHLYSENDVPVPGQGIPN